MSGPALFSFSLNHWFSAPGYFVQRRKCRPDSLVQACKRLSRALVSDQGRSRPLAALKGASVISPTVCADPQGQGMAHVGPNHRPWWGALAMGVEKGCDTVGWRMQRLFLFSSGPGSAGIIFRTESRLDLSPMMQGAKLFSFNASMNLSQRPSRNIKIGRARCV